jgi:hypothetical protein
VVLARRRKELADSTRRTYQCRLDRDLNAIMVLAPTNRHGKRLRKRYGKVRSHLFTFLEHPDVPPDKAILTILRGRSKDSHGPRLHDLRHRLAVNTLLRWYRDGVDVERRLPELATCLGHSHITDTYWYLTTMAHSRSAGGSGHRRVGQSGGAG